MRGFTTYLLLSLCWSSAAVSAENGLAKGQFLVAAHELRSQYFSRTVILLLHYGEDGAMGLIVNRPTDVTPDEAMSVMKGLDEYSGTLYLGGPVETETLRALMLADEAPDTAAEIFDGVHMVPFNEDLLKPPFNSNDRLRFYVGYAGWSAGQLDNEMSRGDWYIKAASAELVFADDHEETWKKLAPPAPLIKAGL